MINGDRSQLLDYLGGSNWRGKRVKFGVLIMLYFLILVVVPWMCSPFKMYRVAILWFVCLLYISKIIKIKWFKFVFPWWLMVSNIFYYVYLTSTYLLWWTIHVIFHVQLCLFTFVLFSFESASYSLHPRPLSEIWLKIFSCSQNLSLYPLIGIFYRAKNLILIKSNFQFFLLWIVHSVSSLKIFSYAFIF